MSNTDQQAFWTDQAGPIWVAQMAAMDTKLSPVLDALLARANLSPGAQVLDIGCGAGTSTLAAARAVGETGAARGFDISEPLLAQAKARATGQPNVSFTIGDAQDCDFPPATFDVMISRFGVMFFEDTTAAFANIARALKPGGRLIFATWGAISENPYFTMPAGVAKAQIGAVPKSDPDAPGPFAMRDTARVTSMLHDAGLIAITAEAVPLILTPPGDAAAVAQLLCEIGPAHGALTYFNASAADRDRLITALTSALAPFETPQGIRIPALINFFSAQKPD